MRAASKAELGFGQSYKQNNILDRLKPKQTTADRSSISQNEESR